MSGGQGRGGAKVLVLSGLQIYPTLSGGNLRSYALANALQHHGLDVFVYSLAGRKADYRARRPSSLQAWPGGIQEYVDRSPLWFLAQYGCYALALPPLWITSCLRAAGASPGEALLPPLLRERLRGCDVVVADFPFVHPIFAAPSARGRLRVLSTHNLEHQLHRAGGGWRDRWLRGAVRRIEHEAAEACDILVACCAADRRYFEASTRVRRSVLVPNGIDPGRFSGLGIHRGMRRSLGIADDVRVFLFTASKYGPNREAFDDLLAFARDNERLLVERRIHILVVGSVASTPLRLPALTATGRVDAAEPYFAVADAALNPMSSGAGTNVKMSEFIAARLPMVTTRFGARGFVLDDGETAFLSERDGLLAALCRVRRLFDEDPSRLRRMADEALRRNRGLIDMDLCAGRLVEAVYGCLCARPESA